MSSARELLEQADALMRRNRRPPRGEDIPELTDAVDDEMLARATKPAHAEAARPAEVARPAAVDDIPELTEAVEEIEAPSIQEYFDDPDELSRWLQENDSKIADRGPPDSIAAFPSAGPLPSRAEPVEAPAHTYAASRDSIVPIDTLIPVEAPVHAGAAAPLDAPTPVEALMHADAAAPPDSIAPVDVLTPVDAPMYSDADAPLDSIAPIDAPIPVEAPMSAFAQKAHAFAREPEAEPSEETIVDVFPVAASAEVNLGDTIHVADEMPATAESGDVMPGSPRDADDPERWKALAEEIRMQVLQRIDIFTDTGLREQLTARLQPVVDRASADLVATINREVGQLLRTYVAEAIEREIEHWRHGGG